MTSVWIVWISCAAQASMAGNPTDRAKLYPTIMYDGEDDSLQKGQSSDVPPTKLLDVIEQL